MSWGHARLKLSDNSTSFSFDFLTSTFGGLLPLYPLVVARYPVDEFACTATSPPDLADVSAEQKQDTSKTAFVVYRGNCKFDEKVINVQTYSDSARLLVIVDTNDGALQRLGGHHPVAGYASIPSVILPLPFLDIVHNKCQGDSNQCTLQLTPEIGSHGADSWIDIAHTEWSTDGDEEMLTQIEGLVYKYAPTSSDIASWLRRKSMMIRNQHVKTVDTDEYLIHAH